MADPTPYETAIHESGHAIVGILCGQTLIDVTIVPADGNLGLTRCMAPTTEPDGFDKYLDTGDLGVGHPIEARLTPDGETVHLHDGEWYPADEWDAENTKREDALKQSILDWMAEVHVFSTLAGPMAEQRVTGEWNADGALQDMLSIGPLIERSFGRDDDRFVSGSANVDCRTGDILYESATEAARERWADDVNGLLDRGWEWIEATAQALLEHGTLTGDEVEALRPADLT